MELDASFLKQKCHLWFWRWITNSALASATPLWLEFPPRFSCPSTGPKLTPLLPTVAVSQVSSGITIRAYRSCSSSGHSSLPSVPFLRVGHSLAEHVPSPTTLLFAKQQLQPSHWCLHKLSDQEDSDLQEPQGLYLVESCPSNDSFLATLRRQGPKQ